MTLHKKPIGENRKWNKGIGINLRRNNATLRIIVRRMHVCKRRLKNNHTKDKKVQNVALNNNTSCKA